MAVNAENRRLIMRTPLAVITGGSRGLGLETARQLGGLGYRLVIAAKNKARLTAAAKTLSAHGFDVQMKQLDMASPRSIATFATWAKDLGPIDVLVNAAGILPEGAGNSDVVTASDKEVVETITTNGLGPWRLTRILAPLIAQDGRIVNVSSGMGGLTEMGTGYFGYRASKAMLNVLTRTLAPELHTRGIMVNSVCPGWVQTDMGGPNATRTVEQGASGIVWAATLLPGGPTNGFFRDGAPINW
jgi:NAD(P)-dependent dehydrogenase (short-subunit alcohol dehydrogenase family)